MPRSIFACTFEDCKAMFRHSDRYERHLLKHTGERPYKCTHKGCDKSYSCNSHLKRHEETHKFHFKCTLPGCSQILRTKETLMKHQNRFHWKKETTKKHKCSECNEEFTKRCMLIRHSYVHTGVQAYKCSEPGCDKSFSMPSLLKKHAKRHVGYFCGESECSQFFPRWSLLLKHRKECHPKIFKCDICEKVFNHSSNLKSHSFIHKLEKDVFRCTVPKCVRVYTSKHSLSDHVRKFHSKFTLPCPEVNCHRFLSSEEALEKHIQHRHRRRANKKPPAKKPEFAEILAGFAKGSKKDLNPHQRDIISTDDCKMQNSETAWPNSTQTTENHVEYSNEQNTDCELNRNAPNVREGCAIYHMNASTSTEDLDDQGSKPSSEKKLETLNEDSVEIEVVCYSLQNSTSRENYHFGCKVEADMSWTSSDMTTKEVK